MNHPSPENLPFVIDVCGRFEPAKVDVSCLSTQRPTTPVLESLIAEEWERQTAQAQEEGRILFNGPLMRYVDHSVIPRIQSDAPSSPPQNGSFHLTVAPTCYRDFVGTNLFNHHRIDEFGWHRFANPIGTTATLVTSDGYIAYGRRSKSVSYHASHVHTFGGGLEQRDQKPDGSIDPFGGLCRELAEELSLDREELEDLFCSGLIRDKEIHQPEMLFEAKLRLTARQLHDRWRSAEARDEHVEIVSVADEPDAIMPFIQSCGPIAPVAIGALMLHGVLRWGQVWFDSAASRM